ncbi:flagellar motor switch protein FliN [Marinicauda pacifica]|jgi:flagellar motor switch protein FliN/FliY|uniref:Flagellar motor switch protein FliN n=1 Tax=Marinicauda pacifica TaxID=1133559 RepID=A0A4S2HDS1_9PROT|nr:MULTISPECIES: flagellar motor switch protein FliN [Marinicauda]TGY93722.1 flagellar motor switch protein FliN [Marinicauda pacifica]GGE29768.1 flagellar motor switch protein FliN [Marinicauda pacifica]
MSDDNNLKLPELEQNPAGDSSQDQAESGEVTPSLIGHEARTAVDLQPVFDVPVNISAVLGKAHIDVNSLLKLSSGSVLELDRKVGEAIDIYVNNRLVARGEVVVVEDRLGVTMTEIIKDGDGS